MTTFITIYVLSVVVNLIAVRLGIKYDGWQQNGDKVFMVFAPIVNAICATFFLIYAAYLLAFLVVNGKPE